MNPRLHDVNAVHCGHQLNDVEIMFVDPRA